MQTSSTTLLSVGPGLSYTRLLGRKLGPDIQAGALIIPEALVAQSWEQPDDTTYLFKLNPAAKWHNIPPVNGRQITAQDVAYSATRQIDLKVSAGFLPDVERFTAVDAGTVRVTLQRLNPDFLIALTGMQNKIVAREAVELKGDLKQGPTIGAGAWIFKEYVPGNAVRFVRNPDYWIKDEFGTQLPYADTLEILKVADQSTQIAAFRARKVLTNYLAPLSWEQSKLLKQENPSLVINELQPGGGGATHWLTLRVDIAPTNDLRVRQAISKAIDRVAVTQALDPNAPPGRLNTALMSYSSEDQLLPEDEVKKALAQDVSEAKKLLEAAGAKNWTPDMWAFTYGGQVRASDEFIQRQLKDVGINAAIRPMDNIQLTNWAYTGHDLQLATASWTFVLDGPHAFLTKAFKTGGDRNNTHLSDPQLDSLIDAQAKEVKDTKRRAQILQQAQRRILELVATLPASLSVSSPWVNYPEVQGTYAVSPAIEPLAYDHIWFNA
jgi:peptide/nickel transport system substrate-binding protein